MKKVVVVCFALLWFVNFALLSRVYDTTIYEEYVAFWRVRGILYDGMFLCVAMTMLLSWNGVEKALACFMVIIMAGSFIDKAIFNIADYMVTDFVLIILAIIVSVIVWKKQNGKISKI